MKTTKRNGGNWREFEWERQAKERINEIDRLLYRPAPGPRRDVVVQPDGGTELRVRDVRQIREI